MNRLIHLLAFAIGAAVLGLLVSKTGLAPLLATIRGSEWGIFWLIAIWGITYGFNAKAWQLLVRHRPAAFTFGRAYLLTITSFGMNFVTPLMSMGGEPIKAAGAMRWLSPEQATGSVIGFRLLHSLAHVLIFIVAAVPAVILLPHTPVVWLGTSLVTMIMAGIAVFLITGHHDGLFVRFVGVLGRIRRLRGVAARLQRKRRLLRELDQELTGIRRDAPKQFALALLVEIVGRVISTTEYVIMLWILGQPPDLWHGFVIANVGSLFTVTFFFIPFEMGAKEGGIYLAMKLLGYDPLLATTAALLSRVREIFWGAAGLACFASLNLKKPSRTPSA